MALSEADLKDEIKAEFQSILGTPDDSAQLDKFCQAIANAVVNHIKNNAIVTFSGTASAGTDTITGGTIQ